MNIVLCENAEKRAFTAGNKARTDTVRILVDAGYKHIQLYRSKSNKAVVLLQMIWGAIKTMVLAKRNNKVFIQYPYYPAMVNKSLITLLQFGRAVKHYKICVLIHDSIGLRDAGSNSDLLRKEILLLDKADYVISHNETMTNEFKKAGGKGHYYKLGPFDYLYEGKPAQNEFNQNPTICVAGNLS